MTTSILLIGGGQSASCFLELVKNIADIKVAAIGAQVGHPRV